MNGRRFRFEFRRFLLAGAGIWILFSFGEGFAAGAVVDPTRAGAGSGSVSGYVASTVHYTLNDIDPTKIDAVKFTLDSAPATGTTVKVRLESSGGWYDCAYTGVNTACNTTSPQAALATASRLELLVSS